MGASFNPSTLESLKRQRRVSSDDLARHIGTSPTIIQKIVEGKKDPTPRQAELLADLFGVPSFELFGETLLQIEDDLVDFRTPSLRPARVSANGLKKIVRAEKHAKFTKFLLDELKDNLVPFIKKPSGELTASFARTLRESFDDWLRKASQKEKIAGNDESVFLTWLRIYTELQGAITATHDAPESDYWGFYTDANVDLASIFVNRTIQSKKAQLFTMCHEMAHYIEDVEGISDVYSLNNPTEIRCNKFAAEFIAPEPQFASIVEDFSRSVFADTSLLVRRTAQSTLLSYHASALRLRELGYISSTQYSSWITHNRNWFKRDKQREKESQKPIPNVHHAKAIGEIGYLPIYLSRLAIDRKIIDAFDVEDGIGLSRKTQDKAFELVTRRFRAAVPDAD